MIHNFLPPALLIPGLSLESQSRLVYYRSRKVNKSVLHGKSSPVNDQSGSHLMLFSFCSQKVKVWFCVHDFFFFTFDWFLWRCPDHVVSDLTRIGRYIPIKNRIYVLFYISSIILQNKWKQLSINYHYVVEQSKTVLTSHRNNISCMKSLSGPHKGHPVSLLFLIFLKILC